MTIDQYSWGYRRNARLNDFLSIEKLLDTFVKTVRYCHFIVMEKVYGELFYLFIWNTNWWNLVVSKSWWAKCPYYVKVSMITWVTFLFYNQTFSNHSCLLLKISKDSHNLLTLKMLHTTSHSNSLTVLYLPWQFGKCVFLTFLYILFWYKTVMLLISMNYVMKRYIILTLFIHILKNMEQYPYSCLSGPILDSKEIGLVPVYGRADSSLRQDIICHLSQSAAQSLWQIVD